MNSNQCKFKTAATMGAGRQPCLATVGGKYQPGGTRGRNWATGAGTFRGGRFRTVPRRLNFEIFNCQNWLFILIFQLETIYLDRTPYLGFLHQLVNWFWMGMRLGIADFITPRYGLGTLGDGMGNWYTGKIGLRIETLHEGKFGTKNL